MFALLSLFFDLDLIDSVHWLCFHFPDDRKKHSCVSLLTYLLVLRLLEVVLLRLFICIAPGVTWCVVEVWDGMIYFSSASRIRIIYLLTSDTAVLSVHRNVMSDKPMSQWFLSYFRCSNDRYCQSLSDTNVGMTLDRPPWLYVHSCMRNVRLSDRRRGWYMAKTPLPQMGYSNTHMHINCM